MELPISHNWLPISSPIALVRLVRYSGRKRVNSFRVRDYFRVADYPGVDRIRQTLRRLSLLIATNY